MRNRRIGIADSAATVGLAIDLAKLDGTAHGMSDVPPSIGAVVKSTGTSLRRPTDRHGTDLAPPFVGWTAG